MAKKTASPHLESAEPVANDDALVVFRQSLQQMNNVTFAKYKAAVDQQADLRQRQELDSVLAFFKTLSEENQKLFLQSAQATVAKKQQLFTAEESLLPKKQKNPLRTYQDYPETNPQYKIARLVNLQLKEVFTGGNPQNKVWLADLANEQRYTQFGTIQKLEADANFLNELMMVPKAVFKLEGEQWIDCCQN